MKLKKLYEAVLTSSEQRNTKNIKYVGSAITESGEVDKALDALDRAPSVKYWMEPEFRAESWHFPKRGTPNSVAEVELVGKKIPQRDFAVYDANGDIAGVLSVSLKPEDHGAFKIVVDPNQVRKGYGSKLLDYAESKGVDIIGSIRYNSFSSTGRELLRSWLRKKS